MTAAQRDVFRVVVIITALIATVVLTLPPAR